MKREADTEIKILEEEVKNEQLEEAQPSATKEESNIFKKPTKTRVALIVGYNGSEFCGSQKNPGVRTVEEEIEKVLHNLGYIADFNFGDLKKIGFNRATRTDKRVHALQNVFSCKVHMDKNEDEEEVRKKVNSQLPSDIRIFCLLQCSNRFNAKNCTSNREYSYYLPSFMLTKITDLYFATDQKAKADKEKVPDGKENQEEVKQPAVNNTEGEQKKTGGIKIIRDDNNIQDAEEYINQDRYLSRNIDHIPQEHYDKLYSKRLTQEDKDRVQEIFSMFLGTKKYHNYSKEVKSSQTAASRYMLELTASDYMYINIDTNEVTNEADPRAIEFIHFFLKGQSFLYNQIRKMIGSIIQVFRGCLENDFIGHTQTDNSVNVALAPGDGLLLEKVCYDKYNSINDNKKSDIMLKLVGQGQEIKVFREDIVSHIARREIKDKAFTRWLCLFDDFCEDFYVKKPLINQ